jgi:hypothetical protein
MEAMPSNSFRQWRTVRFAELDQIANAHLSVGGSKRGRRYATQQINHAYAVLLSSQFQGFCRDLQTECSEHIIMAATKVHVGDLVQFQFGNIPVRGVVKDDRGPIGTNNQRVYVVQYPPEGEDAAQIELPSGELRLIMAAKRGLRKKNGGRE